MTFEFKILAVVILFAPIVVTPVLLIVTSPAIVTLAAKFATSPTMIFPASNSDPIDDTPDIVTLDTPVILPLASTIKLGTCVAVP